MGSWYFSKKENLSLISKNNVESIRKAIELLKDKTPYPFWTEDVDFYCDKGMSVENGVLGATTFLHKNRVLLSPLVIRIINWETTNGIPNNEVAMNTVIHELTHLQQMRKWYGLFYLLMNIPFICNFTLEKWACANGNSAQKILGEIYKTK
jgi:hypothetical protein